MAAARPAVHLQEQLAELPGQGPATAAYCCCCRHHCCWRQLACGGCLLMLLLLLPLLLLPVLCTVLLMLLLTCRVRGIQVQHTSALMAACLVVDLAPSIANPSKGSCIKMHGTSNTP